MTVMCDEDVKERIVKILDMLKIPSTYSFDFDEALEFYRGVALIDNLGVQLGITPEQMTAFFETKDWHELCTNEAV